MTGLKYKCATLDFLPKTLRWCVILVDLFKVELQKKRHAEKRATLWKKKQQQN